MRDKMKKVIFTIVAVVIIAIGGLVTYDNIKAEKVQESIAEHVIRLHVVANSDMENDQKLKLEVKDAIVLSLQNKLQGVTSYEEARKVLENELPEIEKTAVAEMESQGYSYNAHAELGKAVFPVKKYGDLTFPAGEYEALRVSLGEAEGKNWWCVMYPTLCFLDSTYQVVPEESKEVLQADLTAEEYSMLLEGGENISYGFKLLDWVEKMFE